MHYIIYADVATNHALNNEWLMKQQLKKLGFENIRIAISHPVSSDQSERTKCDIDDPAQCTATKNAYGIYVPQDKK